MRISDWSSDVCSSDLGAGRPGHELDVAPVVGKHPMAGVERAGRVAGGDRVDELAMAAEAVTISPGPADRDLEIGAQNGRHGERERLQQPAARALAHDSGESQLSADGTRDRYGPLTSPVGTT